MVMKSGTSVEKLDSYVGQRGVLQPIPLDMITRNELNEFEIDQIEDLAHSIETYGLLTPLSVIGPEPDGKYKLISGERRWTALRYLRDSGLWKGDVPSYIIGPSQMSKNMQALCIEISNLDSRPIDNPVPHYFKVMDILSAMVQSGETSLRERQIAAKASEYLHVTPRYARYIRMVTKNGTEDLRNITEQGQMPLKVAAKISKMEDEAQKTAVDEFAKEKARLQAERDAKKAATAERQAREKEEKKKEKTGFVYSEDMLSEFDTEEFEPGGDFYKDVNLDVSTSSDFNALKTENEEQDRQSEATKIRTVIMWCENIRTKSSDQLTDDEWNAIRACQEVAEQFE